MFKLQELANLFNDYLNNLQTDFVFNLSAEIGETKPNVINGILTTNSADTMVINNTMTSYTIISQILVPASYTNGFFVRVQDYIGSLVNNFNGKMHAFSNGNGNFNISYGVPDNFKITNNLGNVLPLYFTIKMEYTENGTTGLNKKWFLNDYEIPFINEDVLIDKDGNVTKIYGKKYTETFLNGQTRFYKFQFPFQNNALCIMLQQDILNGNFDKQYSLKYYDGQSFTEENPFTTTVSIFKSGNTGADKLKISIFNLTFTDVDNGEDTTKYYIGLIDFPFDKQDENTIWFDNVLSQKTYFSGMITSGAQYEQIKAPNINSLNITSQVYPNTENYDLTSLVNKNYAIIKITSGSVETNNYTEKFLYYFVNNPQIGANNQVLFDLELDTIQTYLFNPNLQVADCLINRAHLNRFVKSANYTSETTVSFDGTPTSKLFAKEQMSNVGKRLVRRTRLKNTYTGQTDFDNWVNKYIYGWIYVFINPTLKPNCKVPLRVDLSVVDTQNVEFTRGIANVSNSKDYYLPSPYTVIAFPVVKKGFTNENITIKTHSTIQGVNGSCETILYKSTNVFEEQPFNQFVKEYGADYIISAKFSTLSPFNEVLSGTYTATDNTTEQTLQFNFNYTGTNDSNLDIYDEFCDVVGDFDSGDGRVLNYVIPYQKQDDIIIFQLYNNGGFILITAQPPLSKNGNYEITPNLTFNKNAIIGANKSVIFNPKLLSSEFYELRVSDETENGFVYDLQKLNKKTFEVGNTETLTPDNTKKYIRIIDTTINDLYIPATKENLTGFVSNNDTTIAMTTTQYQTMIANNKNYFTQNALQRESNVWTGGIMSGVALGVSLFSGNALGIAAGIGGILNVAKNDYMAEMTEKFTVDNLQNAPANVKQALGNCYFSSQYTLPGTYIEEYDILPNDKKVINDYMFMFGFSANIIGNIFDYLNSNNTNGRKYFNYIQAELGAIKGIPLSNNIRNDMRQRFKKGIRFWSLQNGQVVVNYNKENYEKWLEDLPPI